MTRREKRLFIATIVCVAGGIIYSTGKDILLSEMIKYWFELILELSGAIIPAYLFFAFMAHIAARWKRTQSTPRANGVLILRFAQSLLVIFTFVYLWEFIDNVRNPFKFAGGGLASLGLWYSAIVVVLPVFCISLLAHKFLRRGSDAELESTHVDEIN